MTVLSGFIGTKNGETQVRLVLEGERAELAVTADWMGQDDVHVVFVARHEALSAHAGALVLESARDEAGAPLTLPASDGAIVVEYLRVPPQPAPHAGCTEMATAGRWTDPYTLVLWLHRETALAPADKDPEVPADVHVALDWIHHPFKLS
jgi:hypothetical protein